MHNETLERLFYFWGAGVDSWGWCSVEWRLFYMNVTIKDKVIWGTPSFWMNVFPLYYGKEKGFFQEQGIDLEIEYLHGGPELVRAVREVKIQVGTIGLPPFSKAFAEGLPAQDDQAMLAFMVE